MAHRSKELMRAVLDELRQHGVKATQTGKTGGSHQFVEFYHLGRRIRYCFAFSPHSSATCYVRQGIRRSMRAAERGSVPGAAQG